MPSRQNHSNTNDPRTLFLSLAAMYLACLGTGMLFLTSPAWTDGGVIGRFLGVNYDPIPRNAIGFLFGWLQVISEISLGILNGMVGLGLILSAVSGSISTGVVALFTNQIKEASTPPLPLADARKNL